VIITEGREQGAVNLGIYMLDGDTLRLCIGKARPQKFESVAGAGHQLLYYTRVIPRRDRRHMQRKIAVAWSAGKLDKVLGNGWSGDEVVPRWRRLVPSFYDKARQPVPIADNGLCRA
jgi:hypothetical protein